MALTQLFANQAQTTLAGAITSTSLTANLSPGSGALFPSPGANQYFTMTFNDAATGLLYEEVWVTNVTGDTITMLRGQEGSTAKNWSAGDIAFNGWTAGSAANLVQASQAQANAFMYAADTGSAANVYAIALTPSMQTGVDGAIVYFKAAHANTGASTLTVNAGTSYSLLGAGQSALQGGEIVVNGFAAAEFNSTLGAYVLLYCTGGSQQVAAASKSLHAVQFGQTGALGQCALSLSGSNLVLLPRNGNKLTINGIPQTVPSAGVSLAPTGLSATTWYLIYAYMSSGTMTLEASTTTHVTDSATGVEVKSGDSTRTLVGGAYVKTAATFTDSATQRFVISWFNRAEKDASNFFSTTRTTAAANATPVELGLTSERAEFVTWGDTDTRIAASAYGNSAGPVSTQQNFGVGIDNLNTVDGLWVGLNIPASGGYNLNMSVPGGSYRLTEGYHYCVMMGNSNNSATAGWVGSSIAGQRCSVNVAIKG